MYEDYETPSVASPTGIFLGQLHLCAVYVSLPLTLSLIEFGFSESPFLLCLTKAYMVDSLEIGSVKRYAERSRRVVIAHTCKVTESNLLN